MTKTPRPATTTATAAAKAPATAAVALCLSGMLLFPLAPAAARTVTGATEDLQVSDIFCTVGSLTLLKKLHEGQPASTIGGVEFEVTRVTGIDLRTEQGWKDATALSLADARARLDANTHRAVTDAAGTARVVGLDPGLYLVHEVRPATPVQGSWVSADILVTVPAGAVADAAGTPSGAWTCDVKVITKDAPADVPDGPPPPKVPPVVPPAVPPRTPTPTTVPPVTTPPEKHNPPGKGGFLPNTGADVLAVVALGLALVAGGTLLLRSRRR